MPRQRISSHVVPLVILLNLSLLPGCGLTQLKLDENASKLDALEQQVGESNETNLTVLEALRAAQQQQAELAPMLDSLQQQITVLHDQQQALASAVESKSTAQPVIVPVPKRQSDKLALGRVEWVWLVQTERYFAAQISTVLDTSVLFAEDIVRFERDGESWLRFKLERADWTTTVETKWLRATKLKYINGRTVKGDVVTLPVQLAGFADEIEFIVVSRKQSYPQVVLAKNFLTDIAVVDVAEKYRHDKKPELMRLESMHRERSKQAVPDAGQSLESEVSDVEEPAKP